MDVPGFVRLLKHKNADSEVWWDSSPAEYSRFKNCMKSRYANAAELIESLLPDRFAHCPTGISGATTNPRLIAQTVQENPRQWQAFIEQLPAERSPDACAREVYDQAIVDGARELRALWDASGRRCGWLSAQIECAEDLDERALVARGIELSRLAPNVMVKVPGSEAGYRAMERLVSLGCSINNTQCFTVSQAAACLRAIHKGRLRAQLLGTDTRHAMYVVSFMMGRLGAERAFSASTFSLTNTDRRWAEIAVYQALQALFRRHSTPARLLVCSVKIDTDAQGREHCWHLQRTGAGTTLYTLTPSVLEFLIRREQEGRPIVPASGWLKVPDRVLNRLNTVQYFKQAYFAGALTAPEFAAYPPFMTATRDAREGHDRLLEFVRAARRQSTMFSTRPAQVAALERWS